MNTEQSLEFVHQRLRHRHSPLYRELHLRRPERVRRRVAISLGRGETLRLEHVDATVMVKCAAGCVWITHDGDPKDVILAAQESYRAEREDPMDLFALEPCVLEIEFEDDVPRTASAQDLLTAA
jgi:hypothetical protein